MPLTKLPAALMLGVSLGLAGCSLDSLQPRSDLEPAVQKQASARQLDQPRYLEIEVDHLPSGLPCKVVDRPDLDTRRILWRAAYEPDFCNRKAEETRLLLEARGWACWLQGPDERPELARTRAERTSNPPHVVAAWRCLGGPDAPEPVVAARSVDRTIAAQSVAARPPVPAARPAVEKQQSSRPLESGVLRDAVEKDLAAIGQDMRGDGTAVDAALGDLNDDGVQDAIVVFTQRAGQRRQHRLLMAYLQSRETYSLVDVFVLKSEEDAAEKRLAVAIEDGAVRLDYCCDQEVTPTVLVLDRRKLAPIQGG